MEHFGITAQRIDPLLNTRATGIENTDNRHAIAQGHILHFVDFLGMRPRQRTAENGEVFRKEINRATVYRAPAGDHAVARDFPFFHAEFMAIMFDEHVDFFETALIEQQVDALAGRQLATAVLCFDAGFTASQTRHAAAFFEFFNNIPHKDPLSLGLL